MPVVKKKPSPYRVTVDPVPEKTLKTSVTAGLQNKKVQVSIAGIVAIAACGAVGYALTRPTTRRGISRYADQISNHIPRLSRKTSMSERVLNQITDLLDVRGWR